MDIHPSIWNHKTTNSLTSCIENSIESVSNSFLEYYNCNPIIFKTFNILRSPLSFVWFLTKYVKGWIYHMPQVTDTLLPGVSARPFYFFKHSFVLLFTCISILYFQCLPLIRLPMCFIWNFLFVCTLMKCVFLLYIFQFSVF